MTIKKIYLGTWFQRTSIHLKEIFRFLKDAEFIEGLNKNKIQELRKKLKVKKVSYFEKGGCDIVEAFCGDFRITISEDGIMLIDSSDAKTKTTVDKLENFYEQSFGPAIKYLFSLGAPIPKSLSNVKEAYPLIFLATGSSYEKMSEIFETSNDAIYSQINSSILEITTGQRVSILRIKKKYFTDSEIEKIVRSLIFFREFKKQLKKYLNLHRSLWSAVSKIREANKMRYRDFPSIRQELFEYLRTLLFVQARIAQMGDILEERRASVSDKILQEFEKLGLNRFVHLKTDQKYISHLWNMTLKYTRGTLDLLDSLYEENSQRELNIIKFSTMLAVLTGFFGMNIAFPWEERWTNVFASSFIVVALIAIISVTIYFALKSFYFSRKFVIKHHKDAE